MRNSTVGSTLLLIVSCVVCSFTPQAHAEISEKAQLGRELFYDPSFGGTLDPKKISGLACANCHADFDEAANPATVSKENKGRISSFFMMERVGD